MGSLSWPERIAGTPVARLTMYRTRKRTYTDTFVMNPDPGPSDLAREEFRALRATIRERGTLRLFVVAITFVAWATLVLLAWRGGVSVPFAALATLLLLAAGFEIVFATHVGVERIGRYLQAHYERGGQAPPRWEHEAMAIGKEPSLAGWIDPLFSPVFIAAAILNLVPVLMPGIQWSIPVRAVPRGLTGIWSLVAVFSHVAFIIRVRRCLAFAARQREIELQWFEKEKRP